MQEKKSRIAKHFGSPEWKMILVVEVPSFLHHIVQRIVISPVYRAKWHSHSLINVKIKISIFNLRQKYAHILVIILNNIYMRGASLWFNMIHIVLESSILSATVFVFMRRFYSECISLCSFAFYRSTVSWHKRLAPHRLTSCLKHFQNV